ncbi:MAG: thioredoxin family protein [Myxococcales bacterium]
MSFRPVLLVVAALALGCSASRAPSGGHGTISTLTADASHDGTLCAHQVPASVCTQCHPELAGQFKKVNDWCGEHDRPESQCLLCHPDLSFEPLPKLREGADLVRLSHAGEDVPELAAHAAPGKVTVFDFYADWCAPCRKLDAHVYGLLNQRDDLAYRKLNVVSWDSPLAQRHMKNVERLPYVVVYDRHGRPFRAISGFDLDALNEAIVEAGEK